MPKRSSRMTYWPEQWRLIQEIQNYKREQLGLTGIAAVRSDVNVMVNPATGQEVPIADLQYAKEHFYQIYESGAIREARWAFLWYH